MVDDASAQYDSEICAIADYVCNYHEYSAEAMQTAVWCILDSLGCALLASRNPHCQHLLSLAEDASTGVPIPGTHLKRHMTDAAFQIGLLIRWLDYNDTWLAAEWGHPSDNLGAILAVAYQRPNTTLREVCHALIKAYEIQGILALENSLNRLGYDHVFLVKLASTAVVTEMLGGSHAEVCAALSQVFCDGGPLRVYRQAPNTGQRKSWASGDACARAVHLAKLTLAGEPGYPSALTAPRYGFEAVMLHGEPLKRSRDYACYVMENILFKVAYPAEFHGQTAVECALQLHAEYKHRIKDITRIDIRTQKPAMDIIHKTGALKSVADRDHALEYMIAVALLYGELTSAHYEDDVAANPAIDALRAKMVASEYSQFTAAYYDPAQRAIANAIRLHFSNETSDWCEVLFPLGHQRRRTEALPQLQEKFRYNASQQFSSTHLNQLLALWRDDANFLSMTPTALMQQFIS